MTECSSADFCKLTVQEVLDMMIDQDAAGVICKGTVEGKLYNLMIRLEVVSDD